MDKRYQVFVSSTYADLKEERRRVIQTLIEMDCIPAGMELFPAADEEQFEFIKRIIDDCDYYLLIIGGRYGSTTAEGISYTEMEYEYATSHGLKVIALLHENPDDIPVGKSDINPELRAKLVKFRETVATGRLVKFWKAAEELPGLVALSLSKTIKMYPAVGWVRANRESSEDLLSEINELRKQNQQYAEAIDTYAREIKPQPANLAGLDESLKITLRYYDDYHRNYKTHTITSTWAQVFGLIAPCLLQHPNDEYVKIVLSKSLCDDAKLSLSRAEIVDQEFETIKIQFKALGLVNLNYTQTIKGGMALFWTLTKSGESVMLQLRTVASKKK